MTVNKRRRLVWFLLLLMPLCILFTLWRFPLWSIEQLVRFKFEVTHLKAKQLSQRLDSASKPILLFDVRTAEEYAVSHLEGAILVDPDISAAAFTANYADRTQGHDQVFYCSAGYRSSQLAERILQSNPKLDQDQVYNLEGGIFRWFNEGRPVYNQQGSVDDVHPYSDRFRSMIDANRLKPSQHP